VAWSYGGKGLDGVLIEFLLHGKGCMFELGVSLPDSRWVYCWTAARDVLFVRLVRGGLDGGMEWNGMEWNGEMRGW